MKSANFYAIVLWIRSISRFRLRTIFNNQKIISLYLKIKSKNDQIHCHITAYFPDVSRSEYRTKIRNSYQKSAEFRAGLFGESVALCCGRKRKFYLIT